jgi:hypothetical protein
MGYSSILAAALNNCQPIEKEKMSSSSFFLSCV